MGLFGKRDGGSRRRVKLLFTTDLHGSTLTFRKLLRVLELWAPDAVVVGGDVSGKAMVPVAQEADGRHRILWMGREYETRDSAELKVIEDKISQLGFYPYRAPIDEIQEMRDCPDRAERVFEQLIVERWASWLDQLEERCAELKIPAYVMAGNDDPWSLDEVTFTQRQWVRAADGRVLPLLGDWVIVSLGLGNQTPWGCPRDLPEEELELRLDEVAAMTEFTNAVANIHVPPYSSSLDLAPKLDTSVSPPIPRAGEVIPVGSTAVRRFIEEHQPLLSLHGHIHESPGATKIGRTLAINPGSEYGEGILRGVIVTLEPDRVVSHQFVTA
jgi:Icc-related predicted phosphoesterase